MDTFILVMIVGMCAIILGLMFLVMEQRMKIFDLKRENKMLNNELLTYRDRKRSFKVTR